MNKRHLDVPMSSKTIIALVTEHCLKFKISTLLLPEKDIFILSKHIRHDFNNSALYVLWITNITRTFVLAKKYPMVNSNISDCLEGNRLANVELTWTWTCQGWVDWLVWLVAPQDSAVLPSPLAMCTASLFFRSMDSWIQSQSQNLFNQWRSGIFSCCCNCGRSPCSGVDKHRLNRSRLYP